MENEQKEGRFKHWRTLFLGAVGVIMLLLVLLISACAFPNEDGDAAVVFDEVFYQLLNNHYKEPSEQELWWGAINGLISSLDDPYTTYFDKESYDNFRDGFKESFVGIGIRIGDFNGKPLIHMVFDDSPAARAGVMAGDLIITVDGVEHPTYFDTILALMGDEDTEVTIGVERAGFAELLEFTMTREEIPNPSVVGWMLDDTIGYIKINTFGEETANIVEGYVNDFEDDPLFDGLIIDLRDNGGGALSTLNALFDIFLVEDELPFYTLEMIQFGQKQTVEHYGNPGELKPYDIAVLINGQSASASEVFAAAMQEVGGYMLFGTQTFGKGTLQTSSQLTSTEGDFLHISIGQWFTPTGEWVNFDGGTGGVMPDVSILPSSYFRISPIYVPEGDAYEFDQVDNNIKYAQMMLNALGYNVREDGYFDLATETAILDFQAEAGLTETGTLDALTAKALSEAMYDYRQIMENDTQLMEAYQYLLD